jgi:hypothetical protein
MITVQACPACNKLKRGADEDLGLYMALDIGGSRHPYVLRLALKLISHERNSHRRRWLARMMAQAVDVDLERDSGIIAGRAVQGEFNTVRIIRSMSMVVRGLYLHDRGRELDRATPIYALRVPWFDSAGIIAALLSALGHMPAWPVQSRGQNTVWWNHYGWAGRTDQDTLWQVCYFDQVLFLIGTGDYATELNALVARVVARKRLERPILVYTPPQRPRIRLPRLPEH